MNTHKLGRMAMAFVVGLLLSTGAEAQSKGKKRVETTSYDSYSGFAHETSLSMATGSITSEDGNTNIRVGGDYHWLIKDQIQAGAGVVFASLSGTSTYSIYGLATYNFSSDLSESMFVRGGVGMVDRGSSSKFAFKVGFGKRFPIWQKLYLSPYGEIEKITDYNPTIITLVPVNFSIFY